MNREYTIELSEYEFALLQTAVVQFQKRLLDRAIPPGEKGKLEVALKRVSVVDDAFELYDKLIAAKWKEIEDA